ncbi:MAG: hypothetical protein OD815_000115 [Candidatus Alkanophagales archaeon MCA70_species_2]|nr:hypothetical protein [Candidatus Alkanophaga liquidiphilum]
MLKIIISFFLITNLWSLTFTSFRLKIIISFFLIAAVI